MDTPTAAPRKKVQRTLSADERQELHRRTGIEQTVDTVEAAALLGVSPQTMRRWACYGEGPVKPRRACGRLRWPVSEITRVISGETEAA